MRQGVSRQGRRCRARQRSVLLGSVCSLWESGAKEAAPVVRVRNLWDEFRAVQCRSDQAHRAATLLLPQLLVSVQPTRQSLSVGRGARRSDESRGANLAQSGHASGQATVPDLWPGLSARSASHPVVHRASRGAVGRCQRHHALPRLSQADSPAAGTKPGRCPRPSVHRLGATGGVA